MIKKPSTRPVALMGYAIIFVMFGVFGSWAAVAKLDSAVFAPGTISLEGNRKVVQHLEGGIVAEILVQEADTVSEGDILLRLSDVEARSNLDVITTRLMTQGEGMAFGGSMAQVARAAAGEGVLALWRGTGPRMLAVFPYTAIQFSLFEVVRDMLLPAPGEGGDWSGPGRGAVFGLER